MGRWTPLILMAGGLAILLGTLLGISFPMGGSQQNANLIGGRNSKVLPANLDNPGGGNRKTASTNANSNNVAQSNATDGAPDNSTPTAQNTAPAAGSNDGANEPIRALW